MDTQWHCRQRGCGMVFDWQTVYKTHLKNAHGGSRMALDDAKVSLCPQTVFACGFDNCIQVFEAPSDAEVAGTFKEYVAHVIKHLDEGSSSGAWTYSTRMRNLMRQSGVFSAWTNSSWPESERNRLTWDTQSSNVLRKRLETKHIGDLHLLVQYAIALGSNPSDVQEFHESFTLPIKDECQMLINGHVNGNVNSMRMQAPPPPQPQLPSQPQQPPQHAPEQDPFSFKISRGSSGNPQLATYYASQRHQMFVPRPPVRSGRSARPPMRAMPASTMPPQQQGFQPPEPNMFDPTSYYQQQQHQHQGQSQQYQMMSAAEGGIIADDLRSLRSIASSTNSSSTDVEMSDAQIMDSSYMGQQNFSAPYVTGGLQSPAPSDGAIKIEQPAHFGGFDQSGY